MAQLQKIMGFPELIWKSLGYMIYVLLKLCLENGKVFIETICRLPIPLFLSNSLCWMEPCRVDVHTDMHQQGPSYVKLLPARGDSERSSNRNNFHWDIETCETLEILLHSRNKCWSNWNGVIGKLPPPLRQNWLSQIFHTLLLVHWQQTLTSAANLACDFTDVILVSNEIKPFRNQTF